jgi:hypothetical protein
VAGLRPRPTIWVVEGLLVYLDVAEVHRLLETIGALSGPRDWLLTDIVGQSLLSSPQFDSWLQAFAARGCPGGSAATIPRVCSPPTAGLRRPASTATTTRTSAGGRGHPHRETMRGGHGVTWCEQLAAAIPYVPTDAAGCDELRKPQDHPADDSPADRCLPLHVRI